MIIIIINRSKKIYSIKYNNYFSKNITKIMLYCVYVRLYVCVCVCVCNIDIILLYFSEAFEFTSMYYIIYIYTIYIYTLQNYISI